MGTWGMPQTNKERKQLAKQLARLQKIKDTIGGLLGDDIWLDHIEIAIERLEHFCSHTTPECKHPAFYPTEDGDKAPGVCALCRKNI